MTLKLINSFLLLVKTFSVVTNVNIVTGSSSLSIAIQWVTFPSYGLVYQWWKSRRMLALACQLARFQTLAAVTIVKCLNKNTYPTVTSLAINL